MIRRYVAALTEKTTSECFVTLRTNAIAGLSLTVLDRVEKSLVERDFVKMSLVKMGLVEV